MTTIDPFNFVQSCEPDCDDVRHAYHQGQWDMAVRIEEAIESNTPTDTPTNSELDKQIIEDRLKQAELNLKEWQKFSNDGDYTNFLYEQVAECKRQLRATK